MIVDKDGELQKRNIGYYWFRFEGAGWEIGFYTGIVGNEWILIGDMGSNIPKAIWDTIEVDENEIKRPIF